VEFEEFPGLSPRNPFRIPEGKTTFRPKANSWPIVRQFNALSCSGVGQALLICRQNQSSGITNPFQTPPRNSSSFSPQICYHSGNSGDNVKMPVAVLCPNCGKKYTLDEKSIGKKAKCACGHIFIISSTVNTPQEKNADPWSGAFETHSKEDTNFENAAGGFPVSGPQIAANPIDHNPRDISKERSMTKEVLNRLAYGSPGLIIVAALIYYTAGFFAALFAVIFGTIGFCIVMYQGISAAKEQAAGQGLTFAQYQKQWSTKGMSSPRSKIAQLIICISLLLLIAQVFIQEYWPATILPNFDFAHHWKMCLLIPVLNFPILLVLAALMTGDWRKYLKFSTRLFLWRAVPFHEYFKGFWRTYNEMASSKEDLFEWAATNMLYVWVCLLEYLAIKAAFFS
jgi:hypothetical protein